MESKFGDMNINETERLVALKEENAKLKRNVADLTLANVALKAVLSKN